MVNSLQIMVNKSSILDFYGKKSGMHALTVYTEES